MKTRLTIFSIILVVIVGCSIVYFYFNNDPELTVSRLIDKVENGDLKGIELSDEQVNKIKEMFIISDENQLSKPKINLNEIFSNGDEEQILATFEIIQYSSDNQIKNLYVGYLTFTLVKKSMFRWKVLEVQTLSYMKMQ